MATKTDKRPTRTDDHITFKRGHIPSALAAIVPADHPSRIDTDAAITVHRDPLSAQFDTMSEEDWNGFVASVRNRGVDEPRILVHIGTDTVSILDGWHRTLAAHLTNQGGNLEFEECPTGAEGRVVALNLHRRHLTPSMKGAIALRLTEQRKGYSQRQAAKDLGVSHGLLKMLRQGLKACENDRERGALLGKVMRGEMTANQISDQAGGSAATDRKRRAQQPKIPAPPAAGSQPAPATGPRPKAQNPEDRAQDAIREINKLIGEIAGIDNPGLYLGRVAKHAIDVVRQRAPDTLDTVATHMASAIEARNKASAKDAANDPGKPATTTRKKRVAKKKVAKKKVARKAA